MTFGVVTLGFVWRDFKIEASTFKGREPDEVRYDFDQPKLDSFSGRISWNPTKNLALQVSHGYIHSPEELEPDANRHRTTASLIYNRPLGPDANWSNSFVWGQNRDEGHGERAVGPGGDELPARARYVLRAVRARREAGP